MQALVLDFAGLNSLIARLKEDGFRTIGTVVQSSAIVYDEIQSADDFPRGWSDRQSPGHYRLAKSDSPRLFDQVVGPQSLKTLFHKPHTTLWSAVQSNGQLHFRAEASTNQPMAIIGVRPCEIAAMLAQDRVFSGGEFCDPRYLAQRAGAFIMAVNCLRPGGNCFCTSMQTGPQANSGFDVVLTETESDGKVIYVARGGSDRGQTMLTSLTGREATTIELEQEHQLIAEASRQMGQHLETTGLSESLALSHDHSHWKEVEGRCLSCGSCTSVCPTCFCSTVEDTADLTLHHAKRVRKWTSCFTREFTYLHGGHVRQSGASRYRHWITHKLSGWHDQYGSSGCVGCGRCVTWCPVGINIVEEATAISQSHVRDKRVAEEITK